MGKYHLPLSRFEIRNYYRGKDTVRQPELSLNIEPDDDSPFFLEKILNLHQAIFLMWIIGKGIVWF